VRLSRTVEDISDISDKGLPRVLARSNYIQKVLEKIDYLLRCLCARAHLPERLPGCNSRSNSNISNDLVVRDQGMARTKELKIPGLSIENGFLSLETKPTARLGYSFVSAVAGRSSTPPKYLLIFLSGLDSPLWVWQRVLTLLVSSAHARNITLPPMLLYDRFGVGTSDPEPTDAGKRPEEYHDVTDAVNDLHQLITQLTKAKHGISTRKGNSPPHLIFSAHSFGVTIARLYSVRFPRTVSSILIIDSAIASTAVEHFIPNPDVPSEWAKRGNWHPIFLDESLISEEACRDAIAKAKLSAISGYAMTTREHIRWTNMPDILPWNDRPKLPGVKVTSISSDPEVYLRQGVKVRIFPIPSARFENVNIERSNSKFLKL
jgi:pimeloyl-ACP methyl ester carboxylesterase